MIFSCRYSSKARYAVASKDAALDFEKRDVQLLVLVLVCVFEKTSMICERFARAVVSPAGQHDDMIKKPRGQILFCSRGCCLLKGKKLPVLSGYGSWIKTAYETAVLLVNVGFYEGLAVF